MVVGLQALDEGAGGDHLLLDHVAELAVRGDDDPELGAALDLAEPGPQLDPARPREARGDAEVELGVLRQRTATLAGHGGVVHRRRQGCAGRQRADQKASPSEPLRALQRLEVWARVVEGLQVHPVSSPRLDAHRPAGCRPSLNHSRPSWLYRLSRHYRPTADNRGCGSLDDLISLPAQGVGLAAPEWPARDSF